MIALTGGAGNDTLIGGRGSDTMTGGAGADVFQFVANQDSIVGLSRDVITDFEKGSDKIDLSALQASTFIGSSSFSGRAGEVRFVAFDGATIIELDSNGDRLSDFQIELGDAVALSFADFLGLESDASGRSKKTVSITVATSNEQPSAANGQYADPSMTTNDLWLPSSDGLLIYA